MFTCVITEPLAINWWINGQQPLLPPPTTHINAGAKSTLSVSATPELNGASVQCNYLPSGALTVIISALAYLSVQGL